jgi:hypothetical protein
MSASQDIYSRLLFLMAVPSNVFSLVYYGSRSSHSAQPPHFTRLRTRTSSHHSYAISHHKMVPNPAPPPSATITEPLPPLTRSTTLPLYSYRPITTDPTLLTPEDAIYHGSPPRKQSPAVSKLQKELRMTNGTNGNATRSPGWSRHKDRTRSGSRRRKGTWKKLLWVKQSCEFYIHIQWTPLNV